MFKSLNSSYTFKYTLMVFVCILLSSIASIVAIAISINIDEKSLRSLNLITYTVIVLIFSLIIGTIIAFFVSKRLAKQQKELEQIIKQVVSGNFDVQMTKTDGPEKQVVDGINSMIKELKNVSILKSDFISNFSHEFKTPIVSINGFSELLLNENLSKKEEREYLKIIYDESNRLAKLSNNMLFLSNLESSAIVPQKTEFSLDEQIKQSVKLLDSEILKKNLNVTLKLESVIIFANSDMLSQVWINIISNAVKYSEINGHIFVKLTKENGNAIVSIKDTGIGISEDDQKHIFDKFFQCDASRKQKGNGLGLSIAKQIVELHEGTINVSSNLGQGANFVISLPLNLK